MKKVVSHCTVATVTHCLFFCLMILMHIQYTFFTWNLNIVPGIFIGIWIELAQIPFAPFHSLLQLLFLYIDQWNPGRFAMSKYSRHRICWILIPRTCWLSNWDYLHWSRNKFTNYVYFYSLKPYTLFLPILLISKLAISATYYLCPAIFI